MVVILVIGKYSFCRDQINKISYQEKLVLQGL